MVFSMRSAIPDTLRSAWFKDNSGTTGYPGSAFRLEPLGVKNTERRQGDYEPNRYDVALAKRAWERLMEPVRVPGVSYTLPGLRPDLWLNGWGTHSPTIAELIEGHSPEVLTQAGEPE